MNQLHQELHRLIRQRDRLNAEIDSLLMQCPDAECSQCSIVVCPHGCDLHFHHDGCPACAMPEDQLWATQEAQQMDEQQYAP